MNLLYYSESPVFEKMFFGEMAEEKDLIVLPELTAVGFMNIIRKSFNIRSSFSFSINYKI